MQAREITRNHLIDGRMFILRKFTAMNGLKIGKLVIGKLLPLAKDLLPGKDAANKQEVKETVKNLDASILEKIKMETIIEMFDSLSDADMDKIAYMALTNVSELREAGAVTVMDGNGFYQIEDVQYDPVLFIQLIWEELKYGLSDFFDGNRWTSFLPEKAEPAEPEDSFQSSASM